MINPIIVIVFSWELMMGFDHLQMLSNNRNKTSHKQALKTNRPNTVQYETKVLFGGYLRWWESYMAISMGWTIEAGHVIAIKHVPWLGKITKVTG